MKADRGCPVPRPSARSQRSLHPTHFAFLPSDQWSRTPALCHSLLIHLSRLFRFTLSIACSVSSRDAAHADLTASLNTHLHPPSLRPTPPDPSVPSPRLCRTKGSTGPASSPSAIRHTTHICSPSSPPACLKASSARWIAELARNSLWDSVRRRRPRHPERSDLLSIWKRMAAGAAYPLSHTSKQHPLSTALVSSW